MSDENGNIRTTSERVEALELRVSLLEAHQANRARGRREPTPVELEQIKQSIVYETDKYWRQFKQPIGIRAFSRRFSRKIGDIGQFIDREVPEVVVFRTINSARYVMLKSEADKLDSTAFEELARDTTESDERRRKGFEKRRDYAPQTQDELDAFNRELEESRKQLLQSSSVTD